MDKIDTHDGTLFVLENSLTGREKWLFAWYAVSFFAPAIFIFYLVFMLVLEDSFERESLIPLAFTIVFIVAGFRYMASALRKDTMLITSDKIILTEQKGFQKTQRTFMRSEITNIRFLERPELSPHPLAGKTFDYLGFQVQEQVINEMFGDHRVAFDYEGKPISFGRKLFSWDFDVIQKELSTGNTGHEPELPWDSTTSAEPYWEAYTNFVAEIPHSKEFIRKEAEAAKLYVEEFTDGWQKHRAALQELLVRYEDQLTEEQQKKLTELIEYVDYTFISQE